MLSIFGIHLTILVKEGYGLVHFIIRKCTVPPPFRNNQHIEEYIRRKDRSSRGKLPPSSPVSLHGAGTAQGWGSHLAGRRVRSQPSLGRLGLWVTREGVTRITEVVAFLCRWFLLLLTAEIFAIALFHFWSCLLPQSQMTYPPVCMGVTRGRAASRAEWLIQDFREAQRAPPAPKLGPTFWSRDKQGAACPPGEPWAGAIREQHHCCRGHWDRWLLSRQGQPMEKVLSLVWFFHF